MPRAENYNTRQREAILQYIISLDETHVTAAQIAEHFESENMHIGRATIYRHLNKLAESGKLRRYVTDGVSGACYQHVENEIACQNHLHLKCDECGVLQHLECEALEEIQQHFISNHAFEVDALKTVLHGKCNNCSSKPGNAKNTIITGNADNARNAGNEGTGAIHE